MIKKRRPFIAAIFNFLVPGLGYLYVGEVLPSLILPIILLFLPGLFSWSGFIFQPVMILALYGILILILGITSVSAYRVARRSDNVELNAFQRWYMYLIFFICYALITTWVQDNKASIFGFDTFRIPSRSMSETLKVGDFVIADTMRYRGQSPSRGELIVHTWPDDPSTKYITRLIGLPGDVVENKNGQLFINGIITSESYVAGINNATHRSRNFYYEVPKDRYFVLGDNRDNSADSRVRGFILKSDLQGEVRSIWLSWHPSKGLNWDRVGSLVN